MNCLKCGCRGLVKKGFVGTNQRYKGKNCTYQMTRFTPRGYCKKDKSLAIVLYVSGLSMKRIGYIIGVTAQSVMGWIRDYGGHLEGGRLFLLTRSVLWRWMNSAIFKKKADKLWIWKVYDRTLKRCVRWTLGDRSSATFRHLMDRVRPRVHPSIGLRSLCGVWRRLRRNAPHTIEGSYQRHRA
jgi:IS1 family transposase